jgi:hypothetical protein
MLCCVVLCCPVTQDKVEARNADYAKIVRHLHFHNVPTDKPQQQSQYDAADSVVLPSSSEQSDAYGTGGSSGSPSRARQQQQYNQQQQYGAAAAAGSGGGSSSDEDWGAGMKDAEFLVWLGDFNYRVDLPQGFVPDRSNPERPANEQLYQFVLQKVGGSRRGWGCCGLQRGGGTAASSTLGACRLPHETAALLRALVPLAPHMLLLPVPL